MWNDQIWFGVDPGKGDAFSIPPTNPFPMVVVPAELLEAQQSAGYHLAQSGMACLQHWEPVISAVAALVEEIDALVEAVGDDPDLEDHGEPVETYEYYLEQTKTNGKQRMAEPLEELSYAEMTRNDPESILARDMRLDHIRAYAGTYGHSIYDSWWRSKDGR